ncbi:TetR/AcrR family transcriptional regulator [Paenibacillus sp. CC-CFT747]|nr:TetR/AcrR family transcriptional regulator [Paenibacillus sp. CC-CFT747]
MAVDRRKQIVEAAAKSFALFGYKATTMDQVARIANVGKGTIYTFFVNKEELFDEIMKDFIRDILRIAEEAIDPSRPFFENMHRVLYGVLDFRNRHALTVQLTHEIREVGTPKVRESMDGIEKALLAFIRDKVSEAVGKGEMKPCDPDLTAFVILKLYFALVNDWERTHAPLGKEKISQLMDLYLVHGLAAEQP